MVAATKRFIKIILGSAFALGFILFSVENRQAIDIHLFLFSAQLPLFLFAMLCFVLGVLTGGMVTSLDSWGIKIQHQGTRKRLMALENEIKAMHEEQQSVIPGSPGDLEPHGKARAFSLDPRMKRG